MADRDRGEDIRITPESGQVGGVAPAATWSAVGAPWVKWSAIWPGLLIAVAAQMILGAFGLGIGLYSFTSTATGAVTTSGAIALWTAIWAIIALFLGGFVTARLAAAPTSAAGMWYGLIVWALSLVLGTLLAAVGVGGVLGFLPTRALTTATIGTDVIGWAWGFLIGALLALGAAVWGGAVGKVRPGSET